MNILEHNQLGDIRGVIVHESLVQYRSIPYATIPKRFSRSLLLDKLHYDGPFFDASEFGPSSVQPEESPETDARDNQLPQNQESQKQSEDCLRVTITVPTLQSETLLPVVIFIHGGAYFVGSGERSNYSPINFCLDAIQHSRPLLFVSMNYRLGTLGFMHSSEVPNLIPANNGVHDQLRCFEWIKNNIAGFGGDPKNITAIGQSAGAESLCLHYLSGREEPLYNRAIIFSGSPVCMPSKNPEQHQENFLKQAKELGVKVEGRSSEEIAKELIENVHVSSFQKLKVVGAPCSSSEMLPYDKPTIKLIGSGLKTQVKWLESQIISTCTYDGGISHNITIQNKKRSDHAKSFIDIAKKVLKHPNELFDLYEIYEKLDDANALQRICQLESDVGFFSAAFSMCHGSTLTNTYFNIFDIKNPFDGYLPANKYATHTLDVVMLLGGCDDRIDSEKLSIVKKWRSKLISYATGGDEPCERHSTKGQALLVDDHGVKVVGKDQYLGSGIRFGKLKEYVEKEVGEDGWDLLWFDILRSWLDG